MPRTIDFYDIKYFVAFSDSSKIVELISKSFIRALLAGQICFEKLFKNFISFAVLLNTGDICGNSLS